MGALPFAFWRLGEVLPHEALEDGLDFFGERFVRVRDPGYGGCRVEGDVEVRLVSLRHDAAGGAGDEGGA